MSLGTVRAGDVCRYACSLAASFVALVVVAAAVGVASAQAEPMPNGVPGNWALILNEEFKAKGLNTSLWTPEWTQGAMSGQCTSSNLVSQPGNGYLYLEVRAQESTCSGIKNADTGSLVESNPADGKPGHSGFLYTYGYVEWHVYIVGWGGEEQGCPKGGCVPDWPALWSFPENEENEIDTMEGLHGTVCHTWHHHVSPIEETQGCQSGTSYAGWHTYGVDWEPGVLKFYYDGVKVGEVNTGYINATPQYLIMDDVPPGSYGGKLVVPDEIVVEYVRVWQHPTAPTVSTGGWSGLQPLQATLEGTVNPKGADTHYYFQYGTSPSYGSTTGEVDAGSGTSAVLASATILGLHPDTTYHYRIVASNSVGTSEGNEQTFTTPSPPAVSTGSATSPQEMQATLKGEVNPLGFGEAQYYFEYGETTAYGSVVPVPYGDAGSGTSNVPENVNITNLEPGTTYHFRLMATNSWGLGEGKDETFTTLQAYQYITFKGTNNTVWQWWWTPTEGWNLSDLGGSAVGDPSMAVAREGSDDQYIAFRGNNNAIWQWWWTPTNGWNLSQLGGAATSNPSMAVAPDGDQDIAFVGTNGAIWQWWWTPTNGWNLSQLGGSAVGDPSMVVASNGYQYITFEGTNGAIWQWWWTPTNGWNLSQLGGTAVGDPSMAVARNGSGDQYIVFRGTNNAIWQWWWTPTAGWNLSQLGGVASSSPSMAVARNGYQDISFVGANGAVWQWWWTPTNGWNLSQLGGTASGNASMTVAPNGYQDITFTGTNGDVWEWWWTPTNGWNLSQLGGSAAGDPSIALMSGL